MIKIDKIFNIRIFVSIIFCLALSLCPIVFNSYADDSIDTKDFDHVYLIKGELQTLKVHSLTRISITNPEIADIITVNDKEMLISGQGVGQTGIFIWDEFGKRLIIVRVLDRKSVV